MARIHIFHSITDLYPPYPHAFKDCVLALGLISITTSVVIIVQILADKLLENIGDGFRSLETILAVIFLRTRYGR